MLRFFDNPILSARDVPYPATLTFNAGVVCHEGLYLMVFRNDHGRKGDEVFDGTNIGLATSHDGIRWTVTPEPILTESEVREQFKRLLRHRYTPDFVRRIYDPRLTVIEGRLFMCFAVDTAHGICGGVAETDDFRTFTWLSVSAPDNRNMVLFPRRIGGNYARLERPLPVYMRPKPEDFPIWYAESPDLIYWGQNRPVLGVDEVPYANSKIGPAAPPLETPQGWLVTFHAVRRVSHRLKGWERKGWYKIYYAGLMLLDLHEPSRVIGLMREPLLQPETDYEVEGFRGSVIFPCGMILEDSGEVKLYYGAADTSVALASASLEELLARCEPYDPARKNESEDPPQLSHEVLPTGEG
ncbi:MAG TPA: glycoside hydrolase family 130 protein [Opitutaceae bacterium]|nr:glycoside hydrolase family 130 protein [Opitutaceae bacterium]